MHSLSEYLLEEKLKRQAYTEDQESHPFSKVLFLENIASILNEKNVNSLLIKGEPDFPFTNELHSLYTLRKPVKLTYVLLKDLIRHLTFGPVDRPYIWVLSFLVKNEEYDSQSISLEKLEFVIKDFP